MRKLSLCAFAFSLIFAASCTKETKRMKSTDANVPVAEKQPTTLTKHGDERIDNYFWMRLSDDQKLAPVPDEQTKKVVAYLEAENEYYNTVTAFTNDFQEVNF